MKPTVRGELLAPAGYRHYEISNWAKPGFECVHNLGYWRGRPYLGLGAGAHSFRHDRRWWNVRPPIQYLVEVGAERAPVGGEEQLDAGQLRLERVSLGLRTSEGIRIDGIDAARAAPYLEEGLLQRRDGHLALTERGMLLANEVALALV